MRLRHLLICLASAAPLPAWSCLTPDDARKVVPLVDNTNFDDIQDLRGAAYLAFLRTVVDDTRERPPADEAMIFYRRQVGHGADFRVVWFQHGCAVAKASYPAQMWLLFLAGTNGT
jgi:hypothetical protein